MSLAAWPCPECGEDRAEWWPIKDATGILIGHMLRCLHCEKFFREMMDDPVA